MSDADDPRMTLLRARAKRHIRSRMQAVRSAVPRQAREVRSARVCAHLLGLPEMSAARCVALFWPMLDRGEVDLGPARDARWARGASVYYPFHREREAPPEGFAALPPGSSMHAGDHGFSEPPPAEPAAPPGKLDVIVCPALAVAATGHRLGYGRGYYDRVLPRFAPPALRVVVAFEFQLLAELPLSHEDVPCDVVVTDERVLRPGV